MDGDDEYFGTLGGSLMKDLLADLQVDDNDWSLEQLEKELASLDQQESAGPRIQQQAAFPTHDAASLVVSYAQERLAMFPTTSASGAPPGMAGVNLGDGTDAWSLSLQKFTALSLQEDFLAADSARKQNERRPAPSPPGLTPLEGAEDYDFKEIPFIAPPPGLGGVSASSRALPPPVPKREAFPKTPPNSISTGPTTHQDAAAMRDAILAAIQPVAKDTNADDEVNPSGLSKPGSHMDHTTMEPPPAAQTMPPLPLNVASNLPPPMPQGAMMSPPPHMPPYSPGMLPISGPYMAYPPPGAMMPLPPGGVVVGSVVTSGEPDWQSPTPTVPPIQPTPIKAFCNPFPAAQPIPATALETDFMKARDIAYVVHAILKPVLAQVISEDDYFIQYVKRRMGGTQANPITPKNPRDMNLEMTSRETKSKQWATEKSILGHVAKSSVTRPRALIATPHQTPTDHDSDQQKQRAILWKSRVYCDQAYQAYQKVIETWRAAGSVGGVPPPVQLHLVKLMKCMGMTLNNESKAYIVDKEALMLLCKLGKGRILISRVMEQALLPPNAVQAFMPMLLDVVIPLPNTVKKDDTGTTSSAVVPDFSVDRLFRAITGIVLKLNLSAMTLVKCLQTVQSHCKSSISSPARMECVHALLQKGGMVVGQDPSDQVKADWKSAEMQFMSLLQEV